MKRNYYKVALLGIIFFFCTSTNVVNAGFFNCSWFFSGLSEQVSKKSTALIGFVTSLPTRAWDNFGVIFKSDLRKAKEAAKQSHTAAVDATKRAVEEQLGNQGRVVGGLQTQAGNLADRVEGISVASKGTHDGTMAQLDDLERQRQTLERETTDRLANEEVAIKRQLEEQQRDVATELEKIGDQRSDLEASLKSQHGELSAEIERRNREKLETLKKAAQAQEKRNREIDARFAQIERLTRQREAQIRQREEQFELQMKQLAGLLSLSGQNGDEILTQLKDRLQRRRQQQVLTSPMPHALKTSPYPIAVGGNGFGSSGFPSRTPFGSPVQRQLGWKK